MASSETIPPIHHPDRGFFERAYRNNDPILRASLSLDASIRKIHARARRHPNATAVDITDDIKSMEEQASRALEQAKEADLTTWNDHFRLVSQVAFLEQRIMIPLAFEDQRQYDLRKYLVNGVYGISGNIIEQELLEYSILGNPIEREQLRGAIHEQTVIALINRQERQRHIALPPSTLNDLRYKTDIEYWRFLDKTTEPECIPIQVKASPYLGAHQMVPENGIMLTARDFNNDRDFRISRLITKELNGNLIVDPETNTDELAEVDDAQNQLIATIEQKTSLLRPRN